MGGYHGKVLIADGCYFGAVEGVSFVAFLRTLVRCTKRLNLHVHHLNRLESLWL